MASSNLKLAWHFDFHSHRSVRIGHSADFEGIAAELQRHGVEEIIFFAKCHNGFSYYPTRIGTPHPLMQGDVFGGVLKACRTRKIKVLAYISFGIDGEAGRRHPEWAQVFKTGPRLSADHFISVCPFTKYTKHLMLPQIGEIIQKYKPAGFFFDTMGALGVCYCEVCRNEFRAHSGLEIPREQEDNGWSEYGRFRRSRGMALLKKIGDFIQDRQPGSIVGFNQVGCPPQPEKMPASLTRLTLDPKIYCPQSREMSFCASYGAYADRPADIMPTIFNQGWGDWSLAHPLRIEQTVAAIWARGLRVYMGDRLHPEGRLESSSICALDILSNIRARASLEFPPAAALPANDVLLLHTQSLVYGEDMKTFGIDPQSRLQPLKAAHALIADIGLSSGIVAEPFLQRWIGTAKIVVLPELPAIEQKTSALLQSFVKSGGIVLAVGRVPDMKGQPIDWLGLSRDAEPWQDHVWLPSPDGSLPVLVRGPFHKLTLKGAKAEIMAIPPYDLKYGVKFGWGIGPARGTKGTQPALTCRKLGKGTVWYLEAPLFSDYAAGGNWQQIEWFRKVMDRVLPAPCTRLRNSAGNVEMIVRRYQSETWIILVNHGAAETTGGSWPRVLPPLPAYSFVVEVRSQGKPLSCFCNGKEQVISSGNVFSVPVILDTPWKVIKIKWKK